VSALVPGVEEPALSADVALADLRYLRRTVERAGSFTAVPGWGAVAMGTIALVAASVSRFALRAAPGDRAWLWTWLGAAAAAFAVGAVTLVRKARRRGASLSAGPGRKFLLGIGAPLLTGVILTAALVRVGAAELLPGAWLLLYGAGVVAAGAFSVAAVPAMGLAFIAVGTAASFTPPAGADAWLAAGFGLLHVGFGLFVARRHGG
jgi:hypothetical protein